MFTARAQEHPVTVCWKEIRTSVLTLVTDLESSAVLSLAGVIGTHELE